MRTRFAGRGPSLKLSPRRANLSARAGMTQLPRSIARGAQPGPSNYRSGLTAQLVEILDVRTRRAVNALRLGIGRFNHVVFIRRMRSAAMTQTEMACGQSQRIAGKDIAGP